MDNIETKGVKEEFRYVWLNILTGKLSNSWGQTAHEKYAVPMIEEGNVGKEWKLIKYSCLTDEGFEFYNMMKIVTNL